MTKILASSHHKFASWKYIGSCLVFGAALVAGQAFATGLSGRLKESEIESATKTLVQGSLHRSWTAHARENEELGLDIGLEAPFLLRGELTEMGDGTGVLPRVLPVPRLWFSWDLPRGFMVSGSISPGNMYNGLGTYGAGAQFAFFESDDGLITASVLLDFTYTNAFGDLKANTSGLAAQISKDLYIWQPYAGLGFVSTNATVRSELTDLGVNNGPRTLPAVHFYAGARIELVAKLGLQLDMYNATPGISLLMAQSF
jgi:hypothetical protein